MVDRSDSEPRGHCPQCQELYSEPRILPCLHTLCIHCLHKLAPLSALDNGQHAAQSSVLCPVCDTEVVLPPGGVVELVPDLLAEGEILLEQLRNGGQQVACDLCGDERAERRCQDCRVNMCEFCCQAHRRQTRTSGHSLLSLRDLPPGSSLSPAPCCSLHPSEELRLFCKQCALPTCRDCALTKHRGHVLQLVPEAVGKHREHLQGALRDAHPRLGELEAALTEVSVIKEALRKRADALREEVEAFTEGYIRVVQEHREKLLRDIEEEIKRREQALSLRRARLQQQLTDLRTATNFTQSLVGHSPDLHLLRAQGLALTRLSHLGKEEAKKPDLGEVTDIHFSQTEEAGPCQGYQIYGVVKGGGADPERSEVRDEGLWSVSQGQTCSFTVICKDASGDPVAHGGEQLKVSIIHKGSNRLLLPSVQDNRDGTHRVSYTPPEPGELSVGVCLKGRHIQGSPFTVRVRGRSRQHSGIFHCCTFCSSGGQKEARCACGGTMPGGYQGCGHGHKGHPGHSHWSCCGGTIEKSECGGVQDTAPRGLLRTVAL
ncbi:E3 ubiquitin-protein ligase TRIM45 [Discoglossus pictus]